MRLKITKRDDGTFDVVCQPRRNLGLRTVRVQGITKAEFTPAVLPVCEAEEEICRRFDFAGRPTY